MDKEEKKEMKKEKIRSAKEELKIIQFNSFASDRIAELVKRIIEEESE